MPLRGDIFDFDDVIADTEPLHLRTYQLKCVTVIPRERVAPEEPEKPAPRHRPLLRPTVQPLLPDVDDEKTKRGQARGIPRYPVVGPVPP